MARKFCCSTMKSINIDVKIIFASFFSTKNSKFSVTSIIYFVIMITFVIILLCQEGDYTFIN